MAEAVTAPELVRTATRLELHDRAVGSRLWVEFTPDELRRYRPGATGRDLLWRAFGARVQSVVDATAGLGRDAVHLACLGYAVIAIERNDAIAALACDGLARARATGLVTPDNPAWHIGDARMILPTLDRPHAVYLDPMFPPKRKKSAAVRKEMQLLRALLTHDDDDDDAAELFDIARRCARERVVVKRADDAAPLVPNPSASYRGKLVRYDVYRIPQHD
jgi:16S rRNA (guanine1516-N2)-methyltransferase